MLVVLLTLFAAAQTCPTPGDCDEDGWTVADGDCNDGDARIHPGRTELCDNGIDDDCDRFFNEGCSRDAQQSELAGGNGCEADDSEPLAAFVLLPALFWRRRRC